MKSNPYYSCYRKSSNKRPKIPLYFRIFTKARKSSWSRSPPSPFCRHLALEFPTPETMREGVQTFGATMFWIVRVDKH